MQFETRTDKDIRVTKILLESCDDFCTFFLVKVGGKAFVSSHPESTITEWITTSHKCTLTVQDTNLPGTVAKPCDMQTNLTFRRKAFGKRAIGTPCEYITMALLPRNPMLVCSLTRVCKKTRKRQTKKINKRECYRLLVRCTVQKTVNKWELVGWMLDLAQHLVYLFDQPIIYCLGRFLRTNKLFQFVFIDTHTHTHQAMDKTEAKLKTSKWSRYFSHAIAGAAAYVFVRIGREVWGCGQEIPLRWTGHIFVSNAVYICCCVGFGWMVNVLACRLQINLCCVLYIMYHTMLCSFMYRAAVCICICSMYGNLCGV